MNATDLIEDLRGAWASWSVWRSDGGSWLATRRSRTLTDAEMIDGLCQTLMEDSADALREALEQQDRIEHTA